MEYIPRRGVVVRAFTLTDVEEIYTIRNALEMLTLPAIIERATAEDIADLRARLREMDRLSLSGDVESLSPVTRAFHAKLTSLSRQMRVLRVLEGQDEYITRFSAMAIREESNLPEANLEHHRLVDLVEARDLPAFTELMHSHIERSKECCLLALQDQMKLRK